jgi:adenosylcobinamide kinase/adenosylcobinamide-phosphate guanylyltransferase
VCNLTANEMFDEQFNERDGDSVFASVLRGIDSLAERCAHLVVVTNDVGGDTGGYNQSTMRYVELLGRINRALAKRADTVYELVCGIPLPLKGGEA